MKLSHSRLGTLTAIAELTAITAVGSGALLGVMVKNLLDLVSRPMMSAELLAAGVLCNLGSERNVRSLAGISIHAPMYPMALPSYPWMQRTPRKRSQSLLGGDTMAISRLEHNHPENDDDASKPQQSPALNQSTLAGSPAICESSERKAERQLTIIQMRLRTTSNIAGLTFGFLLVKEVAPTIPLWLNLPIAAVLGWSLTMLPMIAECLLEYLWPTVSCDKEKRDAMTPNYVFGSRACTGACMVVFAAAFANMRL